MASTQSDDLDEINCPHYLDGMTPAQCRAARGFLDISQPALATAASVGVSTVRDFEAGRRAPMLQNLKAIQAALETRGIAFVDPDESGAYGVLFREPAKDTAV
jgi:DNA-binding transcriptional regulator YiaG